MAGVFVSAWLAEWVMPCMRLCEHKCVRACVWVNVYAPTAGYRASEAKHIQRNLGCIHTRFILFVKSAHVTIAQTASVFRPSFDVNRSWSAIADYEFRDRNANVHDSTQVSFLNVCCCDRCGEENGVERPIYFLPVFLQAVQFPFYILGIYHWPPFDFVQLVAAFSMRRASFIAGFGASIIFYKKKKKRKKVEVLCKFSLLFIRPHKGICCSAPHSLILLHYFSFHLGSEQYCRYGQKKR